MRLNFNSRRHLEKALAAAIREFGIRRTARDAGLHPSYVHDHLDDLLTRPIPAIRLAAILATFGGSLTINVPHRAKINPHLRGRPPASFSDTPIA